MSTRIGSNIASLQAQRLLGQATDSLTTTYERLSSGMRINRASDDAAGLAIANSLNASTRVYTQATRNISDGVSALSISESAIKEISKVIIRQLELSEQAANGVYTLEQRKAMHLEVEALTNEINRVIDTTSFNGVKLLNGENPDMYIQAGFGVQEALNLNFLSAVQRNIGLGTFNENNLGAVTLFRGVSLADFDADGDLDAFLSPNTTSGRVLINDGSGTFSAGQVLNSAVVSSTAVPSVVADFNGDGRLDIAISQSASGGLGIYYGNGDGSFNAITNYTADGIFFDRGLASGDFNSDGKIDISVDGAVMISNGDGTFSVTTSIFNQGATRTTMVKDINGDGRDDIIVAGSWSRVFLSNGDGTFSAQPTFNSVLTQPFGADIGDIDRDGFYDLVYVDYNGGAGNTFTVLLGNGDGTFRNGNSYATATGVLSGISLTDMNGDGLMDLVTSPSTYGTSPLFVHFGNGDGTFLNPITTATTSGASSYIATGDLNGDGVNDILAATGAGARSFISQSTKSTKQEYQYLLSREGALEAITNLRATLERVTLGLGSIGALQSRLEVANRLLGNRIVEQRAAESLIRDADLAQETAQLTSTQIKQQAAASVLAQANLQPTLAIRLITGEGI